jgi:hypothetical protein
MMPMSAATLEDSECLLQALMVPGFMISGLGPELKSKLIIGKNGQKG